MSDENLPCPIERQMGITQLMEFKKFSTEFSVLDNDYICAHVTSQQQLMPESGPYRVDGITWILCLGGELQVSMNLTPCRMTPHTLLVAGPNSILNVDEVSWEGFDVFTLFMSKEFMHNVNIDLNMLQDNELHIPFSRQPVLNINPGDSELFQRYFELIYYNTCNNSDDIYVRSITRCIVAALCYQVLQLSQKLSATQENKAVQSRRVLYVREFMRLVQAHHVKERCVGFYADRMMISPKYLSLIIKEITGKSAAEWIDDFVILEAKNRLKYSGRNVQQVAYDLHFPNQSAFGKYFKHLTGISPSKYQRS